MTVFGGLFFVFVFYEATPLDFVGKTSTSDFHSVEVTSDIFIGQALARLIFLVIIETQEASVKQRI